MPSSRPRRRACRACRRTLRRSSSSPRRPRRHPLEQPAQRLARGGPGQHVVADLVERAAHVERRRQRVGPAVPGAVPVAGSGHGQPPYTVRPPPTSSLASRRSRCSPSSTNSTAAAASPTAEALRTEAGPAGPAARPGRGPCRPGAAARPPAPGRRSRPTPLVELRLQRGQVQAGQPGPERLRGGPAQQVREHLDLPALLAVLELDLAAQAGTTAGRSPTRATGELSPVIAARRTADAATVSAAAIANRAETPERGSTAATPGPPGRTGPRPPARGPARPAPGGCRRGPDQLRLLPDQLQLVGEVERVVGADLGAEPVLERGDDPAAVGVVLRVGAGHQQQVQRQPQLVAAHLDVALLQHVEQRDLDPLGQVGQLVDGEDAPVGPRHQPEVDGLRVAEGAALGDLDRVDVADQVADAGVRGGQLLAVPLRAVLPGRPGSRRRARR